ncbi:hypothetical protein [Mesorhizobium sp. 98Argb]
MENHARFGKLLRMTRKEPASNQIKLAIRLFHEGEFAGAITSNRQALPKGSWLALWSSIARPQGQREWRNMPLPWLPAQADYSGKLGNVAIDHRTLDEETFVTENFGERARRGASRPVLVLGLGVADADGKDSDSNQYRLAHIGPPKPASLCKTQGVSARIYISIDAYMASSTN